MSRDYRRLHSPITTKQQFGNKLCDRLPFLYKIIDTGDKDFVTFVADIPSEVFEKSYFTAAYVFKTVLGQDTEGMKASHVKEEFILSDDQGRETYDLIASDEYFHRKVLHGYGWPGYIVGGTVAIVPMIVKENFVSFRALSGSIANVSIEFPRMAGVDGESNQRATWRHAVGGLGYVAALATLAPALMIFTLRYVPNAARLAWRLSVAPLFLTHRLGVYLNNDRRLFSERRFAPHTDERKNHYGEQFFRNLNGSLDATGRLKVDGDIQKDHDGRKGMKSTIRHALGAKSPTEYALDAIWFGYIAYLNKNSLEDTKDNFADYLMSDPVYESRTSCESGDSSSVSASRLSRREIKDTDFSHAFMFVLLSEMNKKQHAQTSLNKKRFKALLDGKDLPEKAKTASDAQQELALAAKYIYALGASEIEETRTVDRKSFANYHNKRGLDVKNRLRSSFFTSNCRKLPQRDKRTDVAEEHNEVEAHEETPGTPSTPSLVS